MASAEKIKIEDFQRMFEAKNNEFSERFISSIAKADTGYRQPTKDEFEEYILNTSKLINNPVIARSNSENFKAWEEGWDENLGAITTSAVSVENLKPKYFRANKFLRYNKGLIVSDNVNLEYDLFTLARYVIFNKYLALFDDIYEFGCGSCQNLLMLSEMFPTKRLYGMDWVNASVKIANLLSKNKNCNIEGILFDMLNPSKSVVLKPNSALITIHALEQIGSQHEKFISYILASKPGIVINYEPVLEFYDQDNLLDYLALTYSQKRNYLSGFLTALRKLEDQGKINIIEARRPFLGGVIHEASLIAWKPI